MTGDGRLVEVQATAERVPFDRAPARRAARPRGRRDRGARRSPSRRRSTFLATDGEGACSPRRTGTSSRSCGRRCPGWEIEPLDADGLAGGDGRDLRRERAAQGALRPRRSRPGDRGCSARTPGSSATRSTARPASTRRAGRRAADQADALLERLAGEPNRARPDGHRARRALARPARSSAARGVLEGDDRDASGAATAGFGYDPIFVPARRRPDRRRARRRLEATRTRTAPAPPWPLDGRRHAALERRRGPRRRSGGVVDLGAEHDHVRHHVEPDEQHGRARERLQHRVVLRDADEGGQQLERRLEQRPRRRSPRAAPRASVSSTFVST